MNRETIDTILLIEDDPGDALLIAEMLAQQGCKAQLVTTERLSDGIDLVQKNRYAIILLDLNLPDSNGLSTMTRMLDFVSETSIIVLTGLSDEACGVEAIKAGAQDYLIKGDIDGRLLKRSMFHAIERKKLEIALKEAKDLFERQARIDYLTGVYNRLMFNELMKAELQRAKRYNTALSLIMFDLDHFKKINDTYSHTIGDHVLKEISQLVSDNIRAHDVFARWGGEEFMVLAPKSDLNQTVALAEKLRKLCEAYDFGNGLQATASFGVTCLRSDDTAESFTDRVDKVLYEAKHKGRNRIEAE